MKGNVFQCHGEQPNRQQYTKTVGVLGELINKTFTYAQDVASVCDSFTITVLTIPTPLTVEEYTTNMSMKLIWETSMKTYMKRVDQMETNLRAIYAIIWGQCSPMMQSKLESTAEFAVQNTACDCIWILNEIQTITHRFEGTRIIFDSLDAAWAAYFSLRQGPEQSLHDWHKDFLTTVRILEHYGAVIGSEAPFITAVGPRVRLALPGLSDAAYIAHDKTAAKHAFLALGFVKRSDQKRFGALWRELNNNFGRGLDQFPADGTGAYNLLLNDKRDHVQRHRREHDQRREAASEPVTGVTFLQQGAITPGNDGITHPTIKCYTCQTFGHYAGNCPTETGIQMLQSASEFANTGFTFTQTTPGTDYIPNTWVLLDSQSTVSVFKNKALLKNIRKSPTTLCVHTNGGTQLSTQIGDIPNFGHVWYNPESLANILSMASVRKLCRITMDTSVDSAIHVHRRDGTLMTFTEYKSGLYFFDTSTTNNVPNTPVTDYLLLNTVSTNKFLYTKHEIDSADLARALYRKLGRPSEADFI